MIEDKFCVTLSENNFSACYQAAKDAKLAELRLDLVHLSEPELKKLFGLKTKFIVTYRSGKTDDAKRKDLLKETIDLGADYVDVEIDSIPDFQKEILGYAKEKKCQPIISYHNFTATPPVEKLQAIIDVAKKLNPWKTKIVITANTPQDVATILSLYRNNTDLIAFCMGEKGKVSRLASLFLGAEFTYVSPEQGKEIALGQMDKKTMKKLMELLNF